MFVRSILSIGRKGRNTSIRPSLPVPSPRRVLAPLVWCCLTLSLAVTLSAQSYQGAVRGRVLDASGATIPGTTVTLSNEATAVERSTISNEVGLYTFTSVDPATYSIVAEAPGFKSYLQTGIAIGTQQFLDLDLNMALGDVTEVVTVTEELPVLESATASGGTLLDNQKIAELPNSGRNPFMMSALTPGVVPSGNPRFNRMQDQSGSSQITIAGGPVRGNNYYLDGVPITDSQNRAVIIPTIEAVTEVKVQSNTYDAEMGRTGGGTFNTTLKSGTNVLHGTGFGIMREKELNANNFFDNLAGRDRPDTPYRNYGGSLGGPIWIPKLYDGRNKTFFHVAAEGYDQKSSNTATFAVPTALERVGDFSNSLNSDGSLRTIYDPYSTVVDADGSVSRTPFANNVLPSTALNQVGLNSASYYAAPNVSDRAYGQDNFNSNVVFNDKGRQMAFKADHEFLPNFRMNASYLHYTSTEPGAPHMGYPASSGGSLLYRKADTTQVNAIITPDPTTVVSVRWGFNRFPNYSTNVSNVGGFSGADLGLPASFVNGVQFDGFPSLVLQQFADLGRGGINDTKFYSQNFLASASRFMGAHTLKVGFDYRKIHQDFLNPGASGSGQFEFDDAFTRLSPTTGSATGSEIASLLLGVPFKGAVTLSTPVLSYIDYYAGYIQDDFRVSSKLTLNMGLRLEYESGLREENNNFTVNFDQSITNPISNSDITAKGGLIFAGVDGAPTEQGNTGLRLGPRFGAAYQLSNKTVIRGGVGFFWAPLRVENSADGVGAIGYTQTTPYIASTNGGNTPSNSLSDPFPGGFIQPSGNSLGLLTGIGQSIGYANPDRRGGLIKQFSLDVQHELPGGINLTLAYIGSRSTRLGYGSIGSGSFNINALSPEYFSQGDSLTSSVANPFYGQGGAGIVGTAKVPLNQLLRPFAAFNAVNQYYADTNEASYDSGVVRVQKQTSNGMSLLASATWARAFDRSFGDGNSLSDLSSSLLYPQNPYDLAAEWAPNTNVTPLRFVAAFSYELPFGKGKSMLNGGGISGALAGGWQMNVVATHQTGFPLNVRQASNFNSVLGYNIQRPNATGVDPEVKGPITDKLNGFVNPDAFSTASRFQFGNAARTIGMTGPGLNQWDISTFRSVKLFADSHPITAQFRAEFINAFNTPQFQSPNIQVGGSRFGTISQQRNFPRLIQLGLRFIW